MNPNTFGKLGTFNVDGQVYSQALYVAGLGMPDGSTHNVLYVTTMHNSVYAFDADTAASPIVLWQVNLGVPVPAMQVYQGYGDIGIEIGILGTGAVDPARGVFYVVSETLQGTAPVFTLHALDLTTGAERLNGPVQITGASGSLQFDPVQHIQRPGILLSNGAVYIGFGSHGDMSPWHGWLMSYDASNLSKQLGAFSTTPTGNGAAIWQSARGPAADQQGNIYLATGNGDFDGLKNFGQSVLKISGSGPSVTGSFTPADWQNMSTNDVDLSAGPALVSSTGSILAADKNGMLYVVSGDTLQPYTTAGGSGYPVAAGSIFNLAVWDRAGDALIYVQGEGEGLKSLRLTGTTLSTTPVSQSSTNVQYGRIGLTVSANGTQDGTGILWETTGNYNDDTQPGILHAYDASDLTKELWNSQMNSSRDAMGAIAKFVNPTVANGTVYVPTFSNTVSVYGAIQDAGGSAPTPTISAATNAASYAPGAISPGSLVSVFGLNLGPSNPAGTLLDSNGNVTTNLSETQVLFDGVPAPLLYASGTQVNAIAPFGLNGANSTQVQVVYQGQYSEPFALTVAASAPGILAADGSGAGPGLIFNQDGTPNSIGNPAAPGSIIVFYATGVGQLSPNGLDGAVAAPGTLPAPVLPVSAQVGGQSAPVLYAGSAAGIVEGLIQVNVQIPPVQTPSGQSAGNAVPLVLQVGDVGSQSNLTVAVGSANATSQAMSSSRTVSRPGGRRVIH